ncbi:unnamed protein product [Rhizoctonia solani]|uniref:Fungal-type protein kinase domain-containing protein n=1 Tax=Rhizoctonia solani TaxID=456999 RepID=A0A8H3A5N1_9AGAM|nr:unnamed protein product [Rhizoctonia solani]
MESSSVSESTESSSSCTTNEVYLNYNRPAVGPTILAAIKKCETCDADQLVASANSLQNSSLSSTVTETPSRSSNEATSDPDSSAPDSESPVNIPMVTRELFDSCLRKVLTICNDVAIRSQIQVYQASPKEKSRYQPFVIFANHILKLLKTLQLPGLRDPSPLEIIFQANDGNKISGKGGSLREPDVVLVSLASAKRARTDFQGAWDKCATQAYPADSREQFHWADILISGEMQWHYRTLHFQQPTAYDASLMRSVGTLPTHMQHASFDLSSLSFPNGNTTYSVPTPSLPTPSGSTNHHAPASIGTGNAGAASNTPNERKRPAEHLDQDTATQPAPKRAAEVTNYDTKGNILDEVEKSAINGAEMLRCSLGRRHAFAMIIIDATVWIWWLDRQGVI